MRNPLHARSQTDEKINIEDLDASETTHFWAEAEAAAAWRRSLSDDQRFHLAARDAEIDSAFGGIE